MKHKKLKRSQKEDPNSKSKYSVKKRYLDKNGLFGFQVPEPKPWKHG